MQLLLTLGHNSSAIGIEGGRVIGYEQERLTRIKSSSAYPIDAINRIMAQTSEPIDCVYVSHWFDDYDFFRADNHSRNAVTKYWNFDHIRSLLRQSGASRGSLSVLNEQHTHHDAHAWSAARFAKEHHFPTSEPAMVFVCDGFGNKQEVFSAYEVVDGVPILKDRIHGYRASMGLMYQYATEFCGMKMHQDEYKFLGYESHVNEIVTDWKWIEELATSFAVSAIKGFSGNDGMTPSKSYLDLDALKDARAYFHEMFSTVINQVNPLMKPDSRASRIVIGRFIQIVLENFYSEVISHFNGPKNVILAGGVHYNVKLNNHILRQVDNFCVVPLAGDQGAAIGMWAYDHQSDAAPIFGDLCWGRRDLNAVSLPASDHIIMCRHRDEYQDTVAAKVANGEIVNTITGSMEFGPRALCNTSTLALPTKDNVDAINALNGRNTVMPFAPVVCHEDVKSFFDAKQVDSSCGSHRFMIVTFDYTSVKPEWMGVAHKYPTEERYSGRPQVVLPDQPVYGIIRRVAAKGHPPILINTSLNCHGKPIVYSLNDAIDDLNYNLRTADELGLPRPTLVIGSF